MAKINPNKLLISEIFYSVQCEGITTGIPSVFIRLAMCNLSCGFSPKYVNDFKKLNADPSEYTGISGDLVDSGNATWTCDTMPVWIRGTEWEFSDVVQWFKDQGIYDDILNGRIHIIWTGGEPTIPGHQESIKNFCEYWEIYDPAMLGQVYFEIETNGTIEFNDIKGWINQVNCSPKLSNSGMPKNQRYQPKVLSEIIMNFSEVQFKFVISTEEDIREIFFDFINPDTWAGIPLELVVCMPGLDDRDNFHERTQWILEMAKKYKFRGLTRLHISAWNKVTGV